MEVLGHREPQSEASITDNYGPGQSPRIPTSFWFLNKENSKDIQQPYQLQGFQNKENFSTS
jgi:hypothetical protein